MPLLHLQNFISAIHPLSQEEWLAFSGIWQPFSAKRKTMLTRMGETENHLYFVLDGVQRSFHLTKDGDEATIVFAYPYSFSGVADSFLTQTPSAFFLETLPAIQAMILKATAFALKGVLERQVELQCFSAEEKFRVLMKRSPQVLNLIPHKYLASYLGIDPATFSKLLGSVRI
jgi:CRP-like cAMP-binding protein